ncbi:pilus assembly protein PilZ [Marinobacter vinifirmus]|uniref:Pilus assembly protein PilZ n=1 Tax=Marinobacter vinifirmus TaxID=355591 RepID=A0A7Z1INH9_9GAMM|nr:PilZ domain-containing protein [Marinobacter vinifirmus]OZC37074.1 pilus assembly protein PilZ [Marinobacter vinifirmus]
MEHRLSQRIEGELPILVYKRGMPVAIGAIKDASRRGLFIVTGFDDVRLNQALHLSFRFPEQPEKHHTLKAHVVRRADQGLGVDFDSAENDARVISELILWLEDHKDADGRAALRHRKIH